MPGKTDFGGGASCTKENKEKREYEDPHAEARRFFFGKRKMRKIDVLF